MFLYQSNKLLLTILINCFCAVICLKINNVCKNLPDYATIHQNNRNCWYDPNVESTPADVAKRYGYPFEKYKIITEDGYILSLFRIPFSNVNKNKKNRQPIFLQHGVGMHSIVWLMLGKNSPAFLFADRGFDVWLGNTRGTKFSEKHLNYTTNDREYWNFSFHETGLYDLPATIDFIIKKTGQKGNLTFIGHSMGSTSSFVYSSVKVEHAKNNLARIIAVAPVAYLGNVKCLAKFLAPFRDIHEMLFEKFHFYGIGETTIFPQSSIRELCRYYPLLKLCELMVLSITGLSLKEIQPEYIPMYFNNYGTGLSVKILLHYTQLIGKNGRFQHFDYGSDMNLRLYNKEIPPEYDLSKINVPVHLFYGKNDFLTDERDVQLLYAKLKTNKLITSVLEERDIYFSHNDFIMGKHVDILYHSIADTIESGT